MTSRNTITWISLNFMLASLVTACGSTPPTFLPSSVPTTTSVPSTPTPALADTATAVPSVTITAQSTSQFGPVSYDKMVLSEQSIPIDIIFPLDSLPSDEYVLYNKATGADQEIWIVSLDRKINKEWILCRNCPITDMYLKGSQKVDSGWIIYGRKEYSPDLFTIFTATHQMLWTHCSSPLSSVACWGDFSPTGEWMFFSLQNLSGNYAFGPDLYLFSQTGENYELKDTLSALPAAWSPDNSEYISTSGQLVSLSQKTAVDLSGTLTRLGQPNARFLGWSPDGKYLALAGTNRKNPFFGEQGFVSDDDVTVCQTAGFISGDISSCKVIVTGLINGWMEGAQSSLSWISQERFLWSVQTLLEGRPSLEEIGVLGLDGHHQVIYWLVDIFVQSTSPDGRWVLAWSGDTYALGAYLLDSVHPVVDYLTTTGSDLEDVHSIWLQVP